VNLRAYDPSMSTEQARDAQRTMWTVGNYPAVAERLLPISVEVVAGLPIDAGTTVLDVAVGDGNAALQAARRGAAVTGIDLTPAQIDKARARLAAAGVDVTLQVADAEDLPFNDGTFDVVISVMGVIFAPDFVRASAELGRVVKPGGTVAITAWANDGWGVVWRRHAADLMPPPPPGAPAPDAWGDPAEAVRRLSTAGLDVITEVRPFTWSFGSADEAIEFFTTNAGPFVTFLAGAESMGKRDEAVAALRRALDEANVAGGDGCTISAPYVLATGVRPA
jgi:SAM-dependent methyltransferase